MKDPLNQQSEEKKRQALKAQARKQATSGYRPPQYIPAASKKHSPPTKQMASKEELPKPTLNENDTDGGYWDEYAQHLKKRNHLGFLNGLFSVLTVGAVMGILALGAWPIALSLAVGMGIGAGYEFVKQKMARSTDKVVTSQRLRKNKRKMAVTVVTALVITALVVGLGFLIGPAAGVFLLPTSTTIISAAVSQVVVFCSTALLAGVAIARGWVSTLYEHYKKSSINKWKLTRKETQAIEQGFSPDDDANRRQQKLAILKQVIAYATRKAKSHCYFGHVRKPGHYLQHDHYKKVIKAVKQQKFAYIAAFLKHEKIQQQHNRRSPDFIEAFRLHRHFSGHSNLFLSSAAHPDSGFRPIPELNTLYRPTDQWYNGPKIRTLLTSVAVIAAAVTATVLLPLATVSIVCVSFFYDAVKESFRNLANVFVASGPKRKRSAWRLTAGMIAGGIAVAALVSNPIGLTGLLGTIATIGIVSACVSLGSAIVKHGMRLYRRIKHGHTSAKKYRLSQEKINELKDQLLEHYPEHRQVNVEQAIHALESVVEQTLMRSRHFGSLINPKSMLSFIMQTSADRKANKGIKLFFDGIKEHGLHFAIDSAHEMQQLLQGELNVIMNNELLKKKPLHVKHLQQIKRYCQSLNTDSRPSYEKVISALQLKRPHPLVKRFIRKQLRLHAFKRDTQAFCELRHHTPDRSVTVKTYTNQRLRERRAKTVKRTTIAAATVVAAAVAPHAVAIAAIKGTKLKAAVAATTRGAIGGSLTACLLQHERTSSKRPQSTQDKLHSNRHASFTTALSRPMLSNKKRKKITRACKKNQSLRNH